MKFSTVAASLIAIAALAPAAASAQGAPYKAVGTEPFWSLTIDSRNMRLEQPGRPPVTVATPKVIHGFAGEIYQTRRLNVNIVHKSCSDGMSDRTFRDTVTVTFDGRALHGCGGETVAPPPPPPSAQLPSGPYNVESIAGRRVGKGSGASIRFQGGRISGNTGCNAMNGSYTFERGFLNAGPIATTKRACMERGAMALERDLLDLLGKRLSVSTNRGGKLVMTGPRGRTLVLVRDWSRR